MTLFIVLKITFILIFLIMFLRRPSLTWGIGLLSVTAAVLIDTLLFTFDSEALRSDLGFMYYLIAGVLFGGGTLWLWGLFLPRLVPNKSNYVGIPVPYNAAEDQRTSEISNDNQTATDSRMLYQEIHNRFGREDVLDLMFDLDIKEIDVMPVDQNLNRLIINILDVAQNEGNSGALALAVERILTPPPPEYLPRLEKIGVDSPPTILRHYLLTNFSISDLEKTADDLGIDWEQLDAGSKKEKTRSLLQYLYRRNRLKELVDLMQAQDS